MISNDKIACILVTMLCLIVDVFLSLPLTSKLNSLSMILPLLQCLSFVANVCLSFVANVCLSFVAYVCLSFVANVCLSFVANVCLPFVAYVCLSFVANVCLPFVAYVCLPFVAYVCPTNTTVPSNIFVRCVLCFMNIAHSKHGAIYARNSFQNPS